MKTVLITGAASGIGRAAAILFAQKGWRVAATMREPEKEKELTVFSNLKCFRLDVTDNAQIKSCLNSVIREFGKIDVLINNAGRYTMKPLEIASDDDVNHIIHTNLIGTIQMMKAIIPYYRKRSSGMIINLSSVAGRTAFPYQTIYQSTKWAIEGLSEGMMYELKNIGITIKIVEPGMIRTSLYDEVKDFSFQEYPKEYLDSFVNWHNYLLNRYRKGTDPRVTAKTIYRAATDGKKKIRYTSGCDVKAAFLLRGTLPFCLFRRAMSRITGV